MANGHGGRRPGSGRPKGSTKGAQLKSRLSLEQLREVEAAVEAAACGHEAFQGDSHAFLVAIYKNRRLPFEQRMKAAELALPYERRKLTEVREIKT